MANVTMCPGTGCPLRENCLRYMAEPDRVWQSWADFTTQWHADNERLEPECPKYIPYQSEVTMTTTARAEDWPSARTVADHIEQRLREWRHTNCSGDRLALDDFMGEDSIADLIEFVCDEYALDNAIGARTWD